MPPSLSKDTAVSPEHMSGSCYPNDPDDPDTPNILEIYAKRKDPRPFRRFPCTNFGKNTTSE